jgi:hypothetical protein
MTPNINTLPAEIVEAIVSRLEDDDVMRLSTTCRKLRARTAHRVFHTVRFSNDPHIADAALVAVQSYGTHTKVLRFVGYAGEEDDDLDDVDDENGSDKDLEPGPSQVVAPQLKPRNRDILPPSALILFEASTTLLPSLQQFSIRFDHDYDYSMEFNCPHGACMFEESETWDMIHAREAKLTMCRLWANTYKALAGNKTATGLIIENWSPRGVSTFQTAEWRAYLGQLKTLDIRITGARQAWSFSNSMRGYVNDIAKMQGLFFEHLKTLQTLKLSIWPETPFGMHGTHHMPLPIRATGRMPALQHLQLENIFISSDLVVFILGYKAHLRTIVLRNAQSAAAEYGECASQPLAWSDFFDALSTGLGGKEKEEGKEEDYALSQLVITSAAPLSETEAKTGKINYKTERAAIKQVREELRSDSRRRLFGYGDFHEHHGYFIHDVKTNQQSAISGTDQAAWDRLAAKLDAKRGYVISPQAAAAAEADNKKKEMASERDLAVPESKATKKGRGAGSGKKSAATLVDSAVDGAGAGATKLEAGPAEAGATVDIAIRTTRSRKRQAGDAQEVQPRRSGRIARMRGEGST